MRKNIRLESLADEITRELARRLETGWLVVHVPTGAVRSHHEDIDATLPALERASRAGSGEYAIMPACKHDGSSEAAWHYCTRSQKQLESYGVYVYGLAHAGTLTTIRAYNKALDELHALVEVPA